MNALNIDEGSPTAYPYIAIKNKDNQEIIFLLILKIPNNLLKIVYRIIICSPLIANI